MNTGYKALLKKGAIAIFVSAFVGFVYAAQWQGYVHLPRFIPKHLLSIDSPPPVNDTASTIDTRSAPPEIPKPQNNVNQNDSGNNPAATPNLNNNQPSNPNIGNPNTPNSTTAPNLNLSNPGSLTVPTPNNANPANPVPNNTNSNTSPPIPTPGLKQGNQDTSKNKGQASDTTPSLHYPMAKEGEGRQSSFDLRIH